MSCLSDYAIQQGDAYAAFLPLSNTSYGQAQECTQHCQKDGRCDALTLSADGGCMLRSGRLFSSDATAGPTNNLAAPVFESSTDVVLSCLKHVDDFEGAGRFGAELLTGLWALPKGGPPFSFFPLICTSICTLFAENSTGLSCVSDYQVNLDMTHEVSTMTKAACVELCQSSPQCTGMVYYGSR